MAEGYRTDPKRKRLRARRGSGFLDVRPTLRQRNLARRLHLRGRYVVQPVRRQPPDQGALRFDEKVDGFHPRHADEG